jgi:PAS domain S-box-containing protein
MNEGRVAEPVESEEPRAASALDASALEFTRALANAVDGRVDLEFTPRARVGELCAREEAVRQSEAELRLVTDALPVLVAYVGNDERYRLVNAAYERWLGIERSAIVGRHLCDVLGAEGYAVIREHVARALAGERVRYETDMPVLNGRSRSVEATYVPERAADGSVAGYVALVIDITERRTLERLRASAVEEAAAARGRAEQLYRFAQAVALADRVEVACDAALATIESALGAERAAILTLDEDQVMRCVAWRKLSPEYRHGVEGHSAWPADVKAPEPVLVQDAETEPSLAPLLPILRSERIRALAFMPLFTGGQLLGKLVFYYGEPHVFARHELETAAAVAHHLASVLAHFSAVARLEENVRAHERFAGVLAHDLQNPLGAIINSAQVLLMRQDRERPAEERDRRPLSRIVASGQRMSRMIDQLLDFTRARIGGGLAIEPRDNHLGELCRQALDELELAHPEWRIRCEVAGDARGTWDPDRLLQVISNLVANAGQHGMPGGEIVVQLDGTAPDWVRLEVHNQGAIFASLVPHLFDPFRTHSGRERARGLGLGLFIVRELVRAHGGQVDVTSSADAGTRVALELPRHAIPGLQARALLRKRV